MLGRWLLISVACMCCVSCVKKDESYYLRRGEEIKLQLIVELHEAASLQDLFERQESLTILFDELARVGLEAYRYQLAAKTVPEMPSEALASSQQLLHEMRRLLAIPGARAFLEKCQSRGLERLDKGLSPTAHGPFFPAVA